MSAAVIFRMGADSAGLRKDLENAGQMAKRTSGKIGSAISSSMQAGVAGLGVGTALAAGATIISAGKEIFEFAGALTDASEAMGITTDALQELHGAFGRSGASSETVNKGIVKLSESLTTAKSGGESAEKMVKTFQALGVTWEEISTLSPDQILMRIAASAKDAKDPAERLSLIMDVLGKSGSKMAGGLNSGEEALRKLREETSKVSKEDAAEIAKAGDFLDRLGTGMKVKGAKILGAVLSGDTGRIKRELILYEEAKAAVEKKLGIKSAAKDVAPPTADKPAADIPDSPEETARKKALSEVAAEQAKMAMDNLANETANANKLADQAADREAEDAEKKSENQRQFFADEEAYEREKLQDILEYEREIAEKKKKLNDDVAKANADGQRQLGAVEDRRKQTKDENSKSTLAELAANARNADGAKARAALRLETRSEKARVRGRTDEAQALQQRADDIKRGIGPLKDSEKGVDFGAALEKAKVLADIRDNIANIQNAQ